MVAVPVYTSTNSVGEVPFLYILFSICFRGLFDDIHFDSCEVVSYYDFDLHFRCHLWGRTESDTTEAS